MGGPKVNVNFIVEKDGSIIEVKVLGLIPIANAEEIVKVFKSSPKWVPGELRGEKVRCGYYALSLNF